MGFTSATRSAPGASRPAPAAGPPGEREVGEVEGHDVDRVGDEGRVEVGEVGALEHDHPGVLAQAAPELPVPDIDGVDPRRARRRAAWW